MSKAPLVLEREGRMARLVLNAPPRNEMDGAFFRAFERLSGELPGLDVDGLVVHGRGRHFSSGADVGELRSSLSREDRESSREGLRRTTMSFQTLACLPYPVVAAVSGVCFGSGLELALACGFRIAAKNAVFALPESSFGLMPGCGGGVRLPALVGPGKAVELILSGRTLGAEEAREIGLVHAVTGNRDLLAAAGRLVLKLSDGAGTAP